MSNSDLRDLIEKVGLAESIDLLRMEIARRDSKNILTIISNQGIHHLPPEYQRGKIYVATKGNLDFSSVEKVRSQYESVLTELSVELKSQQWQKIYLVPFGHSTLSMQIKLLVYRVTRIETIDLFYDGKGNYSDLAIDQRPLIVDDPAK